MTETPKHTPGPWTANGYRIYGPFDKRSKHADGLTLIGGVVDDMNDWRGAPSDTRDERDRFAAETSANARLITAAPDLLAALKVARDLMEAADFADGDETERQALSEAQTAIAKAESR